MRAATPAYSHLNATATGAGDTIDMTGVTEPSSVQIIITGTATVRLDCSNDSSNDGAWLNANSASTGYTSTVFLTLPPNVSFYRTYIVSIASGTVTSCFGRGIVKGSLISAQKPLTTSSGAS